MESVEKKRGRKKKQECDPIISKAADLVIMGVYGHGRELKKRLDRNYGYIGGYEKIIAECFKRGYTEIG